MELLPITSLSQKDRTLLSDIYNKDFPLSHWSHEYFYYFLKDVSRSSLGFYLHQDGELVGLVLGRLLSTESSTFCLSALWVNTNFRKSGYGKILVQELIPAITVHKEIKKIILHFRDANDLQNYYSRLGFSGHKICGTYSNGDLKHYMELNIDAVS